MSNRYATLNDVQKRFGVDYSDYDWSPDDIDIYHATNDCMVARASDMIDEYAGTTFTTGGQGYTPKNIVEACCQLIKRMLEERFLHLGLLGAGSMSDEWGSMSYQQGVFELMTPEIRVLIDNERAENAMPIRLTTA